MRANLEDGDHNDAPLRECHYSLISLVADTSIYGLSIYGLSGARNPTSEIWFKTVCNHQQELQTSQSRFDAIVPLMILVRNSLNNQSKGM